MAPERLIDGSTTRRITGFHAAPWKANLLDKRLLTRVDHHLETHHVGVNHRPLSADDWHFGVPIAVIAGPDYPLTDLSNKAYASVLGIMNVSQNAIGEPRVVEAFARASARDMTVVAAIWYNAVLTQILLLPAVQHANHALIVFGHSYDVSLPQSYCAGSHEGATD